MPTTSSSALRYPASSAAPNVPTDIQNLATDLDKKVLPPFTSVSARNTAIPSPTTGQACIVAGQLHIYDGSAWRWAKRGYTSGTTDAGGSLVIPHGLGATPTAALITSGQQGTDLLNRILSVNYTGGDSANIVCYAHRTDTSAALATNAIAVVWTAFV